MRSPPKLGSADVTRHQVRVENVVAGTFLCPSRTGRSTGPVTDRIQTIPSFESFPGCGHLHDKCIRDVVNQLRANHVTCKRFSIEFKIRPVEQRQRIRIGQHPDGTGSFWDSIREGQGPAGTKSRRENVRVGQHPEGTTFGRDRIRT